MRDADQIEADRLEIEDLDRVRYYSSVAWLLLALMALVEVLITLGGDTPWAEARLRVRVFDWLGFFGDLPAQLEPWRLVTYLFVHTQPLHLFVNAALFLLIGPYLCRRIGWKTFLALFLGSGAAAALVFGQLHGGPVPLVGASGAVFGLYGAAKAWEFRHLREAGGPRGRYWLSLAFLLLLMVLMHVASGGAAAWDAHLAGLAFGAAAAPALADRPVGRLAL